MPLDCNELMNSMLRGGETTVLSDRQQCGTQSTNGSKMRIGPTRPLNAGFAPFRPHHPLLIIPFPPFLYQTLLPRYV